MILPMQHVAEWEYIRARKQGRIDASNTRENRSRVEHDYKVNDQVLVFDSNEINRKMDCPSHGPYKITEVHTNGTVCLEYKSGVTSDMINIRRLSPYNT